jgi:xanthine dehydrogenase YagT iron-sulfur-binding subunit
MNPFSRRTFLKGIGTGAIAGIVRPLASLAQDAAKADSQTLGPGEVEISLEINGQKRQLKVEPRVTLLDALRNRMEYTGTKEVCDRGTCGGCTVHLDGKPVYSCMLLAVDAVGKKITTVEGLAHGGKPDPLQQAFVEEDALQCGFCTPGFIMSARALLDKHPHPTRDQIVAGCAGNLCRCGSYPHIFKAIEKASGKQA